MISFRVLATSLGALFGHRGRTFFSTSAVFVGVCAVTLMLGTGQSAQKDLDRRMGALGTNLLTVQAGEFEPVGNRQYQVSSFTTLTPRDGERLLTEVPGLKLASGVVAKSEMVSYGREKIMASVMGVQHSYFTMKRVKLLSGRFFNAEDDRAALRIAVIDHKTAEKLHASGFTILGRSVRIQGVLFRVVGIAGSNSMEPDNGGTGSIYVPLRTAMTRLFGRDYLDSILLQTKTAVLPKAIMGRAAAVLRQLHRLPSGRPNDFTVQDPAALLKAQHDMGSAFKGLMAAVAGVSLLTGCAGIIAVMLLSVRERTGEIGLRRAIGATRWMIALQFIAEAAALSGLGGLAGAIVGFGGTALACRLAGWPLVWPWFGATISLTLSFALGVLAGIAPALRAAFLDPARALVSPG